MKLNLNKLFFYFFLYQWIFLSHVNAHAQIHTFLEGNETEYVSFFSRPIATPEIIRVRPRNATHFQDCFDAVMRQQFPANESTKRRAYHFFIQVFTPYGDESPEIKPWKIYQHADEETIHAFNAFFTEHFDDDPKKVLFGKGIAFYSFRVCRELDDLIYQTDQATGPEKEIYKNQLFYFFRAHPDGKETYDDIVCLKFLDAYALAGDQSTVKYNEKEKEYYNLIFPPDGVSSACFFHSLLTLTQKVASGEERLSYDDKVNFVSWNEIHGTKHDGLRQLVSHLYYERKVSSGHEKIYDEAWALGLMPWPAHDKLMAYAQERTGLSKKDIARCPITQKVFLHQGPLYELREAPFIEFSLTMPFQTWRALSFPPPSTHLRVLKPHMDRDYHVLQRTFQTLPSRHYIKMLFEFVVDHHGIMNPSKNTSLAYDMFRYYHEFEEGFDALIIHEGNNLDKDLLGQILQEEIEIEKNLRELENPIQPKKKKRKKKKRQPGQGTQKVPPPKETSPQKVKPQGATKEKTEESPQRGTMKNMAPKIPPEARGQKMSLSKKKRLRRNRAKMKKSEKAPQAQDMQPYVTLDIPKDPPIHGEQKQHHFSKKRPPSLATSRTSNDDSILSSAHYRQAECGRPKNPDTQPKQILVRQRMILPMGGQEKHDERIDLEKETLKERLNTIEQIYPKLYDEALKYFIWNDQAHRDEIHHLQHVVGYLNFRIQQSGMGNRIMLPRSNSFS